MGKDFNAYARKITDTFTTAGIRANPYLSDDNMKTKIKVISTEHKTPYIVVVGQKEENDGTVTVRFRSDSALPQKMFTLQDFVTYVRGKIDSRAPGI